MAKYSLYIVAGDASFNQPTVKRSIYPPKVAHNKTSAMMTVFNLLNYYSIQIKICHRKRCFIWI